MNYNQTAEPKRPEPIPAINGRIASLENVIESLHKELQALTERLTPYMQPVPEDAPKPVASPTLLQSPFCEKLSSLEAMVRSSVRTVERFNERLEL